ncbi:MAG: 2-C-methyl-D-erythritol 4-phosphate cytidylyltransferase, partial [Pseudomonadota bacterium]
MNEASPLPPFSAVIVAAGKGLRVGGDKPKQLREYRGKTLTRHSLDALAAAGADPIVIVHGKIDEDAAKQLTAGLDNVLWAAGGATRQASVRSGLEALAFASPDRVLIHDAARPDLPQSVIARLVNALDEHGGAIPTLPVVDSLAVAGDAGIMAGKADRDSLRRVQTPQAFRYKAILEAHRSWSGALDAGDDAQVLSATGGSVALVDGDER